MFLSEEAILNILGIKNNVILEPEKMAKDLKITIFPFTGDNVSVETLKFSQKLIASLKNIGVEVLPFNETLVSLSLIQKIKIFIRIISLNFNNLIAGRSFSLDIRFGKRVRRGVAIIAIGEQKNKKMPIDFTFSLKENPIVLIIDKPAHVNDNFKFQEHLETSLKLFTWNIVNLIILVDKEKWRVYSFNMSYPSFPITDHLDENILHSFIPKLYAPVAPPNIKNFQIKDGDFDPLDGDNKDYVMDLVEGGSMLNNLGLLPDQKKVENFKFRNYFYGWIAKIILDKRTGMSYGFVSRQLPVSINKPVPIDQVPVDLLKSIKNSKDFFYHQEKLFIIFDINTKKHILEVPDVWVLTSRSGSDKANLSPTKDIVKMGLSAGKMIISNSNGISLKDDYKPSFDTGVIFAHAVVNAIICSIASYTHCNKIFSSNMQKNGSALVHWHGYFNSNIKLDNFYFYGNSNPSVSCSSPQSAVYAFKDKMQTLLTVIYGNLPYKADVHIEPHHGVNVSFSSIIELANFLNQNKNITTLGDDFYGHL